MYYVAGRLLGQQIFIGIDVTVLLKRKAPNWGFS
jgi:hypothetical protein